MKNLLKYCDYIKESVEVKGVSYQESYEASMKIARIIQSNNELNHQEMDVVRWYAEDGASHLSSNRGIYSRAELSTYKAALDRISNRSISTDITVYRGVREKLMLTDLKWMEVGDIHEEGRFFSTSLNYALAAQSFTIPTNRKVMSIHLPAGSYARYIGLPNCPNQFESEVLVRNCNLVLESIEESNLIHDGQGTYTEERSEESPIMIYHFTARF